ncbi:hypothetical protein AAFF_G00048600 [Aldrovandia affinis]|uniref:Uncharacterized protein n=1 Tax=Aldrovandia affinis TaxID=143900 RepID=A0AAD7S1K1_9TELE|nr:hypothetical protein AAFF_G00048600 [Aldrovandia affinis]
MRRGQRFSKRREISEGEQRMTDDQNSIQQLVFFKLHKRRFRSRRGANALAPAIPLPPGRLRRSFVTRRPVSGVIRLCVRGGDALPQIRSISLSPGSAIAQRRSRAGGAERRERESASHAASNSTAD